MKKKITVLYGPAESGKSLLINHLIPEAGPHWIYKGTRDLKQKFSMGIFLYYLSTDCKTIVIDEVDASDCEDIRRIWDLDQNRIAKSKFRLVFLSQDPEVLTLQPDFYTIFKISH